MRTWPAGRAVVRAHSSRFGSTEFNPGVGSGRFHPFRPGPHRQPVPTLYAADDEVAAASETVFHTVPALPPGGSPDDARERRPRRVFLSRYLDWMWSTLASERDLMLVDLTAAGLAALGLTRGQLLLSSQTAYPATRRWAAALYTARTDADGLVWESRQAPGRHALVLFGRLPGDPHGADRGVDRAALHAVAPPVPFADGEGLRRLADLANAVDVTIVVDG